MCGSTQQMSSSRNRFLFFLNEVFAHSSHAALNEQAATVMEVGTFIESAEASGRHIWSVVVDYTVLLILYCVHTLQLDTGYV